MYPTLTKKQKQILDYIKVYTELNGFAPSLQDIKNHFHLKAISTVHEHIDNLKQKGFIHKEMNQARSVHAINPSLGNMEFAEIPVLGTVNTAQVFKKEKGLGNVFVHRSQLPDEGKAKFFALRINTGEMEINGFRLYDLVVLKETTDLMHNTFILAEIEPDQLVFRLLNSDKGVTMLISPDTARNVKVFKNLKVHGRLVSLIRKY